MEKRCRANDERKRRMRREKERKKIQGREDEMMNRLFQEVPRPEIIYAGVQNINNSTTRDNLCWGPEYK